MREKGGDCYYHVCVKGSVPVVLCSASNTVSILECMVRVRIYPVILYDLHTYILTYLHTYVLLYIYGNLLFGSCLSDHLASFSDFLLIHTLSPLGNATIVHRPVFERI